MYDKSCVFYASSHSLFSTINTSWIPLSDRGGWNTIVLLSVLSFCTDTLQCLGYWMRYCISLSQKGVNSMLISIFTREYS